MLDLSHVTLLFVETRAHDITKRVIDDCLTKADFGDVLIYSDQPTRIPVPGARYEIVPDFPNKKEAGRFYYSEAMAKVETDFALMLEWDAGIFDPTKWQSEFFNYDYVGAPWIVRANEIGTLDVGNGGFTLMSKGLGHFLCENTARYPVTTDWDLCRKQRPDLEGHGFKWPNRDLASAFSWELGPRNLDNFGYHGAFRWIDMLSREELAIRAKFMTETPYLLSKMGDIFRYDPVPWLENELGPEAWAKFQQVYPQRPGHVLQPRYPGYMSPQQRAAMMLMQAQRRGFVSHHQQNKGLKA